MVITSSRECSVLRQSCLLRSYGAWRDIPPLLPLMIFGCLVLVPPHININAPNLIYLSNCSRKFFIASPYNFHIFTGTHLKDTNDYTIEDNVVKDKAYKFGDGIVIGGCM